MIVTTCSGLWGYEIGDVVRFTSTSPYKIVVAGRTSEMIDKYGEAVFGDESARRVRGAGPGAQFLEFHVAPSEPNRRRLPLLPMDCRVREGADRHFEVCGSSLICTCKSTIVTILFDAMPRAFDVCKLCWRPRVYFIDGYSKSVSAQTNVEWSGNGCIAEGSVPDLTTIAHGSCGLLYPDYPVHSLLAVREPKTS